MTHPIPTAAPDKPVSQDGHGEVLWRIPIQGDHGIQIVQLRASPFGCASHVLLEFPSTVGGRLILPAELFANGGKIE